MTLKITQGSSEVIWLYSRKYPQFAMKQMAVPRLIFILLLLSNSVGHLRLFDPCISADCLVLAHYCLS